MKRSIAPLCLILGLALARSGAETGDMQEPVTIKVQTGQIRGFKFMPEGNALAVHCAERTREVVAIYELATGFRKREVELPTGNGPATFSPDTQLLALPYSDSSVTRGPDGPTRRTIGLLWLVKVPSGELVRLLEVPEFRFGAVAFSADNKLVASAGYLGQLRPDRKPPAGYVALWDIATGKLVGTCKDDESRLRHLTFSPNGKVIAGVSDASDRPQRVVIWDVATGQVLHRVEDHKLSILTLRFTPVSRFLISVDDDYNILQTDVATGVVKKLPYPVGMQLHLPIELRKT